MNERPFASAHATSAANTHACGTPAASENPLASEISATDTCPAMGANPGLHGCGAANPSPAMLANPTAAYFNDLADAWEASLAQPSPVQPAVVRIAGVVPGSRVLDLGCGTGIMAQHYLDAGAAEVVGLDIAPRMVEIARDKFAHEPRVRFACADVLDFSDEKGFDVAVVYNAYPHFLDRDALVLSVARLLRTGGRFVVAHSMGREALNAHHGNVPAAVTSELRPAAAEAHHWEKRFELDALVDAPGFYCIAGWKRKETISVRI